MPTFNSNDYLSLPQQVSKNKKDIATLDTRVTNVEVDVAGSMAVPVIGSCQVLAFDTYLSLDIPSQSALGQIVIDNHSHYQREKLFGLTIQMNPNLVDDSAQFPVINGDVMYNAMFVMGARQLVNIATDEYHYVAIATSIDKRFQIEWNFKHSDNTFSTAPDLIVTDIRTPGLNKLTISYAGALSNIYFKWKKHLEHTFRGNIRILQYGFTVAEGRISDANESNSYAPQGYIAGPALSINMTIGRVKTADPVYDELYISISGLSSYISGMTVELWADDSRELEQTTITDYNMYSGSNPLYNINYPMIETIVRTGNPPSSGYFADKLSVHNYALTPIFYSIEANSVTAGGATIAGSITFYSRIIFPLVLVIAHSIVMKISSATNNATFSAGSPLVINAPASTLDNVQVSGGANYGRLIVRNNSINVNTVAYVTFLRVGNTIVITPIDSTSISITAGTNFDIMFISDYTTNVVF